MPLLYANNLASAEHLAIDPDLDGRVKSAIEVEMSGKGVERTDGVR